MVSCESLEPLLYNENHNFLYISQYSQVIHHKKALIISDLTLYNLLYSIESRCLFITFSQTLFLSFAYFYYGFSKPQAATTSMLSFRLGYLSNETIFTFLHAPKDEKSCLRSRPHTRDTLLPKHSSSNHMRSVEASLLILQLYTIQSCLIGQISCEL